MTDMSYNIMGVDFTSRPTKQKPITVAQGRLLDAATVKLNALHRFVNFASFDAWLREQTPWLGAFDLPLGLPRELVESLNWPQQWLPLMQHYCSLSREEIRHTFKAFCDARPAGNKFVHRATDKPAGSSPSMKWVNPPVAYMLHAGVQLLLNHKIHIPILLENKENMLANNVILEGYPGLLARELIARRSYKSDEKRKQDAARLIARKDIITALEVGRTRLALRLKLTPAQASQLIDDGTGDLLDATLCLMQAAWAARAHAQGDACYGLPAQADALEGWIVTSDLYAAAH